MTIPEPVLLAWSGRRGLAFFLLATLFGMLLGAPIVSAAEPVLDPVQQLRDFTKPEAPPALLNINLNDSAAEVFVQGAWKTGIGGYLGFSSTGDSGADVNFPGFAQKPWYNSVDFLASIWINRQFFFETTLSDGLKFNTFSLGYANIAVPGLNKVQIANTGIDVPEFSWLSIGSATAQAPGLLSEWSTENSRHFAMIRLVNRSTVTQEFRGTSSVVNQRTRAEAFIRGQFFQLPYTNLVGITVWIQSSDGTLAADGHRYSRVGARDFLFIDPQRGRFGLKQPASGRMLAGFGRGGGSAPVSFPALDAPDGSISALDIVDIDSLSVASRLLAPLHDLYHVGNGASLSGPDGLIITLGSETGWLLYEPGKFSVFEDCSWYPKPQNLVPDGVSLDTGTDPNLALAVQDDLVHLARTGASGLSERYPLLGGNYPDRGLLYLPGYQASAGRFLAWTGAVGNAGAIVLDNEPVPSSIVVMRNGQTCTAYSWNPETHALVFSDPVDANDFISVTYDLKSGTGPRTIQFVQANRIDFLPWLGGTIGLAVDWPLENAQDASTQDISLGRIMAGADLRLAPPDSQLAISMKLAGRMDVPGATGATNLQTFDGQFLTVSPGIGSILPSWPSTWLAAKSLDGSTRGRLAYRDYRGTTGDYLPYDNTGPVSSPYENGQATGPYLAKTAAGDPFTGQVSVGEFSLANAEDWVSWELRLTAAQRLALASSGSLSWWLKSAGLSGDGIDVWLEAGTLAEDIDNDGRLASARNGDYGLVFNDGTHSRSLVAASTYQNSGSTLLTEDANANGRLDAEGLVVVAAPGDPQHASYAIPSVSFQSGTGEWSEMRIVLGRSDRIRLLGATAIRLVVRKQHAATTVSGRLLVGNIHIDLPGLEAMGTGGMAVSAAMGSRSAIQNELATSFPAAVAPSAPPAYEILSWQGGAGAGAVFSQTVNPVPLSSYGKFFLFLRADALPAQGTGGMVLQLADGKGSISSPAFDPGRLSPGIWYRLQMDFDTGRFLLEDGQSNVLAEGASQISGHAIAIESVKLMVMNVADSSGTVLIDSLQLTQGNPHISGNIGIGLDWDHPGSLLEIGSFPVLSMFRVHESLKLLTGSDLSAHPGLEAPASTRVLWEGIAGLALAGLDLEIGNNVAFDAANFGGSVSYRLAAPIGFSFPLGLKDGFSGSVGTSELRVGKTSAVDLVFATIGGAHAAIGVAYNQGKLLQDWQAGIDLLPGQAFWWKLQGKVAQQSLPSLLPDFLAKSSLVDQLGQGYGWYVPLADSLTIARSVSLDDHFGLRLEPLLLSFDQTMQTIDSGADQLHFSSKLDFTTEISIGKSGTDGEILLQYNRQSSLAENWHGTDAVSDLAHGFAAWGQVSQAWAVVPVWELFDPSPAFASQTEQWPSASIKPALELKLARSLDPALWAMLLPKQFNAGLGRQLKRTGAVVNDDFLAFAGADWLVLNQFGKFGSNPVFSAYETDQLDVGIDFGTLYRDQQAAAWQIQADLAVKLFGLAHLPGTDLGGSGVPSIRKPDGVLDVMEPDQFGIDAAFYHREGLGQVTAFRAGLDFSWAIDVGGLQAGILNYKPSSQAYLENIEKLSIGIGTAAVTGSGLDSALSDLYTLQAKGDFPTHSGMSLLFEHKTFLVLPGMFYIAVFLGYGLDVNQSTLLTLNAIQGGVEARIRL